MIRKPLRLIVCGASGRMGARVRALALEDPRFALVGGISLGEDISPLMGKADLIVDFTSPEASVTFAAAAARAKKPIVIGTTGFSTRELSRIKSCARRTAVLISPNFSRGVNLMFDLAARAARILAGYDASVSEIHHNRKKDAPSGTALRLARAVGEGRKSQTPVPAVSQRLGDVVGEHTLTLAGPFERLEITHRAHSRDVFARGALEAALWLLRRQPGLYDMGDLMQAP